MRRHSNCGRRETVSRPPELWRLREGNRTLVIITTLLSREIPTNYDRVPCAEHSEDARCGRQSAKDCAQDDAARVFEADQSRHVDNLRMGKR
jgi:hypothetical protein